MGRDGQAMEICVVMPPPSWEKETAGRPTRECSLQRGLRLCVISSGCSCARGLSWEVLR